MVDLKNIFLERLSTVSELVERTNKSSVLIIQQFCLPTETVTKFPKVRESISNILAFIELGSIDILLKIIDLAEGHFDHIVFDADAKLPVSNKLREIAKNNIKKSNLFFYSDINTWADSAVQFILQTENNFWDKKLRILGQGLLHEALIHRIKFFGVNILENNSDKADVLIGSTLKNISAHKLDLENLKPDACLYDIGIGNFSEDLIKTAALRNHPIYRIDVRAGISSLIIKILETHYLIKNSMGKTLIKNIELVAGGVMGGKNAIIVDDINYPLNIIGVADGKGYVKLQPEAEDHHNIAFIERLIKKI